MKKAAMLRPLVAYRMNCYSQNGEDGVLAEILSRLDISSGWCCEFGAWDGKHLSNTFRLLEQGWRGVMIECDRERYGQLESTAREFPDRLIPLEACVDSSPSSSQCLDSLLSRTPIPREFDVLSIDVDGEDYHIWDSITHYDPKIVIIEIDSSFLPWVKGVHRDTGSGSSFASMVELGRRKGYAPVCHTGNVFFVRNDLAASVGVGTGQLRNPWRLFVWSWTPLPYRAIWKLLWLARMILWHRQRRNLEPRRGERS